VSPLKAPSLWMFSLARGGISGSFLGRVNLTVREGVKAEEASG
jgi:hypothetical protein